jgi:hypothetical protein
VLYRLPELLEAPFEEPVYFVEGEKDCDLVRSCGCTAVTTAQGANNFSARSCRPLKDRHVVIIPDNDAAGYKHAATVAGACMMVGAASIRIARWEPKEVPAKGDFANWFNANNWPDAEAIHRRFFKGSLPYGVVPTDSEGHVNLEVTGERVRTGEAPVPA